MFSFRDEFGFIVAEGFVSGITALLLLGILVFTIFGHLSRSNPNIGEIARALNAGFFLLLVLVWIPFEVLTGYTVMELLTRSTSQTVDIPSRVPLTFTALILGLIYRCLYLLTSFIVASLIIKALKTSITPFTRRARQWTIYTLLAFVIEPVVAFIVIIAYSTSLTPTPRSVNIAFTIFGEFSISLTILGILKIVKHSTALVPVIDTENIRREK
jgi:hypothetical protein